jgi:hypothetical protein
MRRSTLAVGLNAVAVGLVVGGIGTVLGAVAFIGDGSPDLGLVSGVGAAVGAVVVGYAVIAIGLFSVGDPEGHPRRVGMRRALYLGAAGLLIGAVGTLVGAIGFVDGNPQSRLNVASGAIGALGLFVLAHAAAGIGLLGLSDRPDDELDRMRWSVRTALFTASAGLVVGAGGTLVTTVGDANSLQAGVVLGGVLAAVGSAVVAVAVASVAARSLRPLPGSAAWRSQSNFRTGVTLGALGFLGQAAGTFLSAMSAVGSGHTNLLVSGGVVSGCGLVVLAAGFAVVAGPGASGAGFSAAQYQAAPAYPPADTWPGPVA